MIHLRALFPTVLLLGLLSIAASAWGSTGSYCLADMSGTCVEIEQPTAALDWQVAAAEYSLLDAGSTKLQRCYRRCDREHGGPSPSPAPTRSPAPTVDMDCSDGTIGQTASRRTYEPGRIYHLCLNVPATATAPAGILQIDSVNHANASCNVYQLTLTRPDGAQTAYLPMVAPIARPNFMRGKWGVTVRLDPDNARCANNPGLSLWAYWF